MVSLISLELEFETLWLSNYFIKCMLQGYKNIIVTTLLTMLQGYKTSLYLKEKEKERKGKGRKKRKLESNSKASQTKRQKG